MASPLLEGRPGRDAAPVVAADVVVTLEGAVVLVVLQVPAGDQPFDVDIAGIEPRGRRVVCHPVRLGELAHQKSFMIP